MGNSQRINKYIIKPVSGSKVHISLPYDSHEQMNYLGIQVPKGIEYRVGSCAHTHTCIASQSQNLRLKIIEEDKEKQINCQVRASYTLTCE